jgi:hypothetical protein
MYSKKDLTTVFFINLKLLRHYFPSLFFINLASLGFSASLGTSQVFPTFTAPSTLFSAHRMATRLAEIPHFFAASVAEI